MNWLVTQWKIPKFELYRLHLSEKDSDQRVNSKKIFKFDKVIDDSYTQRQVFDELHIKSLIGKVLDGYHATIFAYGQTGSGKTYTMEGYDYVNSGAKSASTGERNVKPVIKQDDNIGVSIRAIMEVFDQAKKLTANRTKNIKVSCSFLQIYNEKIFDLLNLANLPFKGNNNSVNGLRMRWNKSEQFVVENLFIFEWFSAEDALKLFNTGIKNRIVAAHNMNNASSRSHCIFTINVEQSSADDLNNVVISKLQLVDLAGSERAGLTGNTGVAYKESIDINKSLLTLRKVINGLADKKSNTKKAHIPYRESKLTCLLKQSLGGNSYCLMIACLPPSDLYLDENISTLTYATKASYIANEPNKNEDPRMKIINELRRKVASLEKELKAANDHITFLSSLTGVGGPK